MKYADFIAGRSRTPGRAGFEPDASLFPAAMRRFQRLTVTWACRIGRAALFAGTGLGKTLMQLVWAKLVRAFAGGRVLILCPLAVAPQTVREAGKFGIDGVKQCDSQADVGDATIVVTNFAKLDKFDAGEFVAVVIDESGILKNYTGKTKQTLIERFASTPYKLCCTATPAPNDHMELGNHAEFLGVMPANEMLTRWFINDQAKANNYRIKHHAKADFWRWVASWGLAFRLPSDVTGDESDDAGYVLPPLHLIDRPVDVDARGDGALVRNDTLTATTLHKEMRLTAPERAKAVADQVNATPGLWVVWCHTDYEAAELMARIPDAVEIAGHHSDKVKERRLIDFAEGRIRVLVTKPTLAGFGLNWQHCFQTAVVGLSYSFEAFHQLLRRFWRFGQVHEVYAHVFYAITEGQVLAAIRRKERDFEEGHAAMVAAVRESWHEGQSSRTLTTDFGTRPLSLPTWLTA